MIGGQGKTSRNLAGEAAMGKEKTVWLLIWRYGTMALKFTLGAGLSIG